MIALIAGIMIGILAYRIFSPSVKQADKIKSELDAAREELTDYKANVYRHFDKTSELVNDLTQNYVKVYQHLAEGAHTLADGKNFNNLLEQRSGSLPVAPAEETKPAVEVDEQTAEQKAPPVDEHAAPFTESERDQSEPVPVDEGSAGSETMAASEPPGQPAADEPAANEEPVLNVDALNDAGKNGEDKTSAEAAELLPEGEDTAESRTTRH